MKSLRPVMAETERKDCSPNPPTPTNTHQDALVPLIDPLLINSDYQFDII